MVGLGANSSLLLVKGTATVPATYTELCQFYYGEDPERLEYVFEHRAYMHRALVFYAATR
jgi:hypothetical protein